MFLPKFTNRCVVSLILAFACFASAAETDREVDVCIYGATPAGVVAAVTAKQEGRSVLLIEPSRWLGGILGAGLKPKQDCPEPRSVGGLTQSIVFTLGDNPLEIRESYSAWLKREDVTIVYEHRVRSVEKTEGRIRRVKLDYAPPGPLGVPTPSATPDRGLTVAAKVFIDASYEGDLMALAGVRYSTGREPVEKFGEKPAGVNAPTNWTEIDPYVRPGVPASGLLPYVEPDHGKGKGAGDDYTQAYNFRFYVTNDPSRRAPIARPANYSPAQFELVGRFVENLVRQNAADVPKLMKLLGGIFPGWPNSGDYNYQRESLVSIAPLGVSRFYQDGNWTVRARVWQEHIDYLAGLHYFLSTDPRVPEEFRKKTEALGFVRELHADTQGWPHQLYVRISRRMVAAYVVTHADVLNQTTVSDSVGLALYGVDTYPVRRYVAHDPKTGKLGVATEGNMWLGGARGTKRPYAMPYRAIVPKAEQCTNLIVPVCFSATYIAYASARMEPVFCVLGESAGVAAAQAIRSACSVQDVNVQELQRRLVERGQVLEWKP